MKKRMESPLISLLKNSELTCTRFLENTCQKKVVVLAPGASDISEGMACLHQGECTEQAEGDKVALHEDHR
jgi:hypothetical protein